jgi:hypothetical protein
MNQIKCPSCKGKGKVKHDHGNHGLTTCDCLQCRGTGIIEDTQLRLCSTCNTMKNIRNGETNCTRCNPDTKEPITKNPTKDEVSSSRQESHRLSSTIIAEVSSSESLEKQLKDILVNFCHKMELNPATPLEVGEKTIPEQSVEALVKIILLREQEAEKRTIAKLTKIWSEGDKTIKEALELLTNEVTGE